MFRRQHHGPDTHKDIHLEGLNLNVGIGDQFDSSQINQDTAYISSFDAPFMSKPIKQIQSTYISKVACGLEHALLLTSSGFVYSMGFNTFGQLGGEQQIVPESFNNGSEPDTESSAPPQMVFALLNTKVTDI